MGDFRQWLIAVALLVIAGSVYLLIIDLQSSESILIEVLIVVSMIMFIGSMILSMKKGDEDMRR